MLDILTNILAKEQLPEHSNVDNLKTSLASVAIEQGQPQGPFAGAVASVSASALPGGRRRSVRASKEPKAKNAGPKGPQPSAKRIVVDGRKRVVYLGPRGGQYVKRDGKFVRV